MQSEEAAVALYMGDAWPPVWHCARCCGEEDVDCLWWELADGTLQQGAITDQEIREAKGRVEK